MPFFFLWFSTKDLAYLLGHTQKSRIHTRFAYVEEVAGDANFDHNGRHESNSIVWVNRSHQRICREPVLRDHSYQRQSSIW